ncbi:hypothetical protein MLD38_013856 [Melastoma candidum]|uniref:Uncharacterized protein n=1 Tax=Melastoma candidum TaxID=119954 RepID=A0ACB9RCT4_9MYRT|nr:hypothetical protein MLD38_013856 [Melastoma candidum]
MILRKGEERREWERGVMERRHASRFLWGCEISYGDVGFPVRLSLSFLYMALPSFLKAFDFVSRLWNLLMLTPISISRLVKQFFDSERWWWPFLAVVGISLLCWFMLVIVFPLLVLRLPCTFFPRNGFLI